MPPPNTPPPVLPEETAETFTTRYYTLLQTLTARISQAQSESDLTPLHNTLAEVRNLFSCGTQWWVGYEIRKAQDAIHDAESMLDAATRRLKPRQRFRFKERSSVKAAAEAKVVEKVRENTAVIGEKCVQVNDGMVKDGAIVLTELGGKDVNVNDIQDVRVVLADVAGALRVTDVERCEIVAAGVAGSVHVLRVKNCVFWVRCRQLRVHESSECLMWLDVRGEPVIEGCRGMQFGPVKMRGVERIGERAGVGGDKNRWAEVKDFQWLMKGQSPNWWSVGESEWLKGVVEFGERGSVRMGRT